MIKQKQIGNFMKKCMHAIYLIFILIIFSSCLHNKEWKREKVIRLKYYSNNGVPVIYETEKVIMFFDKVDVMANIQSYLKKYEKSTTCKFLEYLKIIEDTVKLSPGIVFSTILDTVPKWSVDIYEEGDTIVSVRNPKDERNYYDEYMLWAAIDLLGKGKCLAISKENSVRIDKIKRVYTFKFPGTKFVEFYFDDDVYFLGAIISIG